MAMLPKLKLKALVNFPANVIGGTGIGITKANGNFTVDLDYSEFAFLGSLPAGSNVLVWDPIADVYTLVPPSATGGISDAPSDGLTYGRRSGAWVDAWASPALTGSPTAPTPTAGDNDTSVATTAFVTAAVAAVPTGGTPSNTNPLMDGVAAPGAATAYSRGDHVHPIDTSRAPLASPVFTGDPQAPTPSPGDNDTSIATTAFVTAAVVASTAGVASIGTRTGAITLNGGSMATNELPAPRYDVVQTLTDDVGTTIGQKTQARKNIYAAPFDALAYNGMQVNGSMEVSQERGTATFSGLGNICDGWLTAGVGSAVLSSSIAASGVMTTNGIPFYLGSTVTTASPTLAAGDNFNLQQRIEGYRIARLGWGSANAKPITISFWTDHVRTGTYSVTVRNGASTRSYATTYTQVGSGVWQYNTVTITGCTDGVWAIDNTNGMSIIFSMGSGTTSTAPSANGWVVGSFTAAPGQINAVAATSDIFRITGVVVLPGIEAPTAAQSPLIMRPYDQELVTCQRYYRKLIDKELTGQFTSASAVYLHASFGVPFRAAPALTLLITTPTIIEIGVGGRVGVASAITTGASTTMGGYAEINGFSGATARTAAVGGTISISADARL